MADIDGCRVHADRPVSGPHDLCHKCVQRIDAATKRLLEDRSPTRLQAQTLLNMGRPLAVSLERWPDLLVLIKRARDTHGSVPAPITVDDAAGVVAEVVPLKRRAAADLEGLVVALRSRAELGQLALDLRRESYRDALAGRLAEAACHGLEDAAAAAAVPVAASILSGALSALGDELAVLVTGDGTAEGMG